MSDSSPGGTSTPSFDAISIRFSNAVRGAINDPIRVQAITENTETGTTDHLEEDTPGEGFAASLSPEANFPICEVTPGAAPRSEGVSVAVEGLIPDSEAMVFFGEEPVGSGPTDSSGNADIPFAVPDDAGFGLHLVSVVSEETALTADCFVQVLSAPVGGTPVVIVIEE
jgi:hypothetical protein